MITTVINLIGPPGAGKTYLTAKVFTRLIEEGFNIEPVSEYAKELVFEQRKETMKNEIYLFAKQHQRMFRLKDKVQYVITDRPIILSVLYNNKYGTGSEIFNQLVLEEHNRYNNINILLKRTMPYKTIGREQSEEESDQMYDEIVEFFEKYNISYFPFDSDNLTTEKIVNFIKSGTYFSINPKGSFLPKHAEPTKSNILYEDLNLEADKSGKDFKSFIAGGRFILEKLKIK